MHYLYVIYSKSINKYYVGETPNVKIRIDMHNKHYFKSNYTKSAIDWALKLEYQCQNREEALYLERFIKRMKSRVFIDKIIQNQNILTDILKKR